MKKKFGSKKFLIPKNIWIKKNFRSKNIRVQKKDSAKRFTVKKVLGPTKFWFGKKFESENIYGGKKFGHNFCVQQNFGSNKNCGPRIGWRKILGPKSFWLDRSYLTCPKLSLSSTSSGDELALFSAIPTTHPHPHLPGKVFLSSS